MKKAVLIFLIIIYAFTTAGVAIKADYCCDHLRSVKLVLADGATNKDGCYKIKYQSLKIKDAHAGADILTAPALPFTFIHTLNSYFQISDLAYQQNNGFVNIHAPPLYPATPVYIANCVFRI